MKKLLIAFVALSVVTLGLTACKKRITIAKTSEFVTHPVAHKGDFLVFQASPASKDTLYVHFPPGGSPCAGETISAKPGKPLECQVKVDPSADTRYLYYIDTNQEVPAVGHCPPWCSPPQMPLQRMAAISSVGHCPPWCSVVVVAGSAPGSVDKPFVNTPPPSNPYQTDEIPIEKDDKGEPFASDSSPFSGQPVTWYRTAPDSGGWSVQFSNDVCVEKQPIVSVSGEAAYCTIKADAGKYYSYTITLPNGQPGPASRLYVVPAPTPPKLQ